MFFRMKFSSVLSFDSTAYISPHHLHIVYGLSKDSRIQSGWNHSFKRTDSFQNMQMERIDVCWMILRLINAEFFLWVS
jgi:hypothetical protein